MWTTLHRLWRITEPKVKAAGATAGAASIAIAVLNDVEADHSLLGGMPAAAQTVILAVIPTALVALAGFKARHASRPPAE